MVYPMTENDHSSIYTFTTQMPIRFSHCDPAGIVYFPQYLVLTNWLVEDWFTEGLGINFAEFINQRKLGLPIVKLECEFVKPSSQGEQLTMSLALQRLGRRSITIDIVGSVNAEVRMRSKQVLVSTSLETGCSTDFPKDVRTALEALQIIQNEDVLEVVK